MPYPGIIRPPRIGLPKGKLRDNLVFAVAPRDHLGFYQGGNPPVEHAGSYGVNEYGPAFRAAAAADRLEYRRPEDFASRINAANETTIFVLASMDLTSSDAWAMFLMAHSNDDSHVSPFGDLGFHRNGSTSAGMIHYNHGGFTQIASASGFIVDDELHAYAVTKDSGGNATFYRDGAEHSTGSSGNVMQLTTTATTIIISERNRTDTGHGAVGDFNVGYVFDRALTAEEIAELSGDPFGPLRVQRMPVFLPATQVEGGTTTHEGSLSEQVTFGDSPSITADFVSSLSEQVTFAETLSSTADFEAGILEALGLAETTSNTADFEASVSEPILLSDTVLGGLVVAASLTEAITFAASVDADISIEAGISESLSLTDTLSVSADFAAALTEQIDLAESASTTAEYEAAVSEAITLAETLIGGVLFEAGITEEVTLSSTVTAQSIVTGVTLADGRTFTIVLESRTFSVEAENRTHTVPAEDRTHVA